MVDLIRSIHIGENPMTTLSQSTASPKWMFWVGWGMSGLMIAFLLFDSPALFSGKKSGWQAHCLKLIGQVSKFGPNVTAPAGGTYINLLRSGKKFGILQPSSGDRLDIGIKIREGNLVIALKARERGTRW